MVALSHRGVHLGTSRYPLRSFLFFCDPESATDREVLHSSFPSSLENRMNSTRSLFLVSAVCSSFGQAAPSRPLEGELGLGAGVGLQNYSGSYGSQGSPYARALAEYHPREWLGTRLVGGMGNIGNGDRKPSFETEWFSHVGLELALQPELELGPWRPFLSTGLAVLFGTATADRRSPYDLDGNLYVPVAIGTEYLLAKNWSIWANLETYLVMQNGDKLDGHRFGEGYFETRDELQRLAIGATWRLGRTLKSTSSKPDAASRHQPGDQDADGVVDASDRCPNTPSGMIVDAYGCPSDSDRDGIPDLLDDCPSTPVGNKVDENGCSITNDKDHDGVSDANDRCPNTPRGSTVDANGCPLAPAQIAKVDKPEKPQKASDSDQDGVPDSRDLCPGTRKGIVVDATGCAPAAITSPLPAPKTTATDSVRGEPVPMPEMVDPPVASVPADRSNLTLASGSSPVPTIPVGATTVDTTKPSKPIPPVATKPEKDSDKDGIPDSKDRCRATPVGKPVDSLGCSAPVDPDADTDKDGVRDIGDQCPNSKYGMKVDATGCQILSLERGSQAILEGVTFQPGTARLQEESLPVLEHVARVLRKSGIHVEIAGFSERRGPEGENISMSQRRAESVKDHLVKLGVEPTRISTRGYGSAEPIADNAVEAGRTRNRRIELRVR